MNYYDTLIEKALSGGGGGGGGGAWYGVNPVLLDSWSINDKLSDTTFSQWTPSTSPYDLYPAQTGTPIEIGTTSDGAFTMAHQYCAVLRYCFQFAYKTENYKPRWTKIFGVRLVFAGPSMTATLWKADSNVDTNPPSPQAASPATDIGQFVNSSGNSSAYSKPTNGIYVLETASSLLKVDTSGTKRTIALGRPLIRAVANGTYMTVDAFNDVDPANTTLKAEGKLYQIDGGFGFSAMKELADIHKNGL